MAQPISILKCNFCNKVFYKVIKPKTYEIHCPKCHEIDVMYIGQRKDK